MNSLEQWRRQEKLSYARMALQLDENVASVFAWCTKGRRPRETKWKKLTRKTGLTKAQLLGIA